MRNLPTYDDWGLILERNKTVEFFNQNPQLLSQYSKGIAAHKDEWSNRHLMSDNENKRRMIVHTRLRDRLAKMEGSDKPFDGADSNWTVASVLSGYQEGYSLFYEWEDLSKSIVDSKSIDDFITKNSSYRAWKFPEEGYGKVKDISQYDPFFSFIKRNFKEVQSLLKWAATALKGIKGSDQKAFTNQLMKLGLSSSDLAVAMSHVTNWTSMSRKKLPPEVWPLLQKISVDSTELPKYVYRGIFFDGAKIKDRAKFMKLWQAGSSPGASQGKATSWSVDRGTAAEFMDAQDFIKDQKGGFFVLLRWPVNSKFVIADLRNLPVDHTFWNQQELIVDPAARDYEVDTIIPGDSEDALKKFKDSIKGGQGGYGRSKADFVVNFLNTPYETLNPNDRMAFKQASSMTVGELMQEFPSVRISGDPIIAKLPVPLWNYMDNYLYHTIIDSIEGQTVKFHFQIPLSSLEYIGSNGNLIRSTYQKFEKSNKFNQFYGTDVIISSEGTVSLVGDSYYNIDIDVKFPKELRIEKNPDKVGKVEHQEDIKSNENLRSIFEEVGSNQILEILKTFTSQRPTSKNIQVKID
jgi:hypothetical protein